MIDASWVLSLDQKGFDLVVMALNTLFPCVKREKMSKSKGLNEG